MRISDWSSDVCSSDLSKEGAMTLRLYYHPFSSYCQKVLIALYENPIPFEAKIVDLGDAQSRAAFAAVWPLAKFPVLREEASGLTIPESTTVIEYLAQHHPGPTELIRSEEHTSELQSLMRISYAVFCLK